MFFANSRSGKIVIKPLSKMKKKYFVNYICVPAGAKPLVRELASIAQGASHCVYDRPSLEKFADYLRKQQDLIVSQRPRLKPVVIDLHFAEDNRYGLPTGMSIGGQAGVSIVEVAKEIYDDGAGDG